MGVLVGGLVGFAEGALVGGALGALVGRGVGFAEGTLVGGVVVG